MLNMELQGRRKRRKATEEALECSEGGYANGLCDLRYCECAGVKRLCSGNGLDRFLNHIIRMKIRILNKSLWKLCGYRGEM